MPFAVVTATMSPAVGCPLRAWGWMWQPSKSPMQRDHGNPQDVSTVGEHPSAAKWGSALGDLRAMRGFGCDPLGSAVPAWGLGFTQEGQRDTARKWSNPSPAAGRALVTKPNGTRPAERSRARRSEIAFQGAGGRGGCGSTPSRWSLIHRCQQRLCWGPSWRWQHPRAENSAPCH